MSLSTAAFSYTLPISNLEAMHHFATSLGKGLAPGSVILLEGDLGVGKTTFTQSLIRPFLPPASEITSPTFGLVHHYPSAIGPIWHFDLYRLQSFNEIYELGWEEAIETGICIIEWPEIIFPLLPSEYLRLQLSFDVTEFARIVYIEATSSWTPFLSTLLKELSL